MQNNQKKLLCEVAEWHIKRFHNDMKEHWDLDDRIFNNECNRKIEELEEKYKLLYGDLPEWKSIYDVMCLFDEIKSGCE